MSSPLASSLCLLVAAAVCGCASSAGSRSEKAPAEPQQASAGLLAEPVAPAAPKVKVPAPGQIIRAGGDMQIAISGSDGDFRSGPCRIDTPLPVGYPEPTPPGAIDIKTYPSVRLAEFKGGGNPDRGMNRAFWPLFNHIKKHNIEMTSPVEMEFQGLDADDTRNPESWSMAFLYRTPELNKTGTEGDIIVRDSMPLTVVAIGLKGDYSMSLVERGMRDIEDWLAANPDWEAAGSWRTLYYNGPSIQFWNKWAEVQMPIRPRG